MLPTTTYLDNAATTRVDPEVVDALVGALRAGWGNPSSRHAAGQAAAAALDGARAAVARAVGAAPRGVVLTSGGTEANNLGILGAARARRGSGRHVLVGPTEHASVRLACAALAGEGFEVEALALDARGGLDLAAAAGALRPDTVLVACMLANNEVGTVYPVERLARLVRARAPAAALHVDAVQAFGKLDVRLEELGCDSLALSAHKVHGPLGIGALVLAAGATPPRPLVHGGGQEAGLRSGTENVPGAVGFGVAAALATERLDTARASMGAARDALLAGLADVPGARVVAAEAPEALPSIVAFELPGPPAEVRQHHLERHGVVVGTTSACQDKKRETSPGLLALGLDAERAARVLRVSFARTTTPGDVERLLVALRAVETELGAAAPRGGPR